MSRGIIKKVAGPLVIAEGTRHESIYFVFAILQLCGHTLRQF